MRHSSSYHIRHAPKHIYKSFQFPHQLFHSHRICEHKLEIYSINFFSNFDKFLNANIPNTSTNFHINFSNSAKLFHPSAFGFSPSRFRFFTLRILVFHPPQLNFKFNLQDTAQVILIKYSIIARELFKSNIQSFACAHTIRSQSNFQVNNLEYFHTHASRFPSTRNIETCPK